MRYPTMKTHRGSGTIDLLPWLLVAMSLFLGQPARAADSPRQQAIALNAGQAQVIQNLDPGSKPAIRVIQNSHALVIHNEDPSKLVLLGAEEGKWAISVKLKDGEDVTYNITVSPIPNASTPLNPPSAPAAIGDESSATSAPVAGSMPAAVSALDRGAGP